MNGRTPSPRRVGSKLRVILQLVAVLAIALPAVDGSIGVGVERASADPAANTGNVSKVTAGALTAGTVPDGTCAAKITAVGGGGASSPVSSGLGGLGGAGASVTATFSVVPGQAYSGTVAAGGATPGATSAAGGAGAANGGNGGTVGVTHPGGGGGGSTNVIIGGSTLVVAGGGGGGGGAHSASPAGNGGGGGFSGIAAGTTAVGSAGSAGVDTGNTVSGGGGGQNAAGGTAGTNSGQAARNGSAGLVAGGGGNGGPDGTADSGGGGGAGYTGGGGGAATVNDGGSTSGSGGGGGSSRVAATSPVSGAPAPTGISGAAGTASPTVSGAGATGSITIDWIPCQYDLNLTKTVSSPTVNAGGKVTWTVAVKNNGPNVMTRGDTVSLTDTLPAGPNGAPSPAYKVTAVGVSGATSSGGLDAGTFSCSTSAVTVGAAMPTSTTCSRPYAASSAGGPPAATGTRGLDIGETLTITYEQVISSTAPCATITNTATVKDRPSLTGTTDIQGSTITDTVNTPLTVNCYDLSVTKTVGSPTVNPTGTITWTIAVTNNGPGPMTGPDDTAANPLVITDNFPSGSSIFGPSASTQTGPAGPCSLSGSTITCTNGLAAGATETLLYTQVVKSNATAGTVYTNTATVTDGKTPTTNNSSTASTTVAASPTLNLQKTVSSRANAADQFTVGIANGASTVNSATTSGAGTTASTGATTLTSGTTYTLTDAMAGGSVSTIGQYTKSISCSNTNGSSTTVLPSGSGASFSITPADNDVITCTFTNGPTAPTLNLGKSISSRFAASDQFKVTVTHGATTDASATTAGAGTTASTGATTLVAGTTYTLGESLTAGTSSLADYASSISCTNSTTGTGTTLPTGAGQSFTITPAAGDVISCTLTNTAKPHITLAKSIASRVVSGDQFTVAITHGATTDASASTSGAGTSATTGSQGLVAGTTYTLSESVAGGTSSLSDYLSSISCSNAAGGSATVLPSGNGTSFTITPAAADNITCTITNTAKPHLTLVKSVASRANAADQFTVSVKNGASTVASATTSGAGASATTGSQTLTGGTTYTLTDAMAGGSASVIGQYASSIACTNTKVGSATTLPSGSGTSFSVTPANGDNITCTITNTAGTASLGLTKNALPSTGVTVGTVITYTYGVTNTGSLPLTNVTVTDPHSGLSAITCAPAQGSTLAAAATMSCSATYTVTQADVDAGSILNTGTVTAKDPSNSTVTQTAGKTVTAAQSASLSLTKTAAPDSGVVAGNVVTYTFAGKNTGSVTLHNVTVTDPMSGLSAISCSPGTPATLAPNATISCTATYTVTQANVDAGSFTNTATIAGLDPSNNPVSGAGSATVNTLRVGSATLTKNALPSSGVVAGDVVTYSMHGTNTGTVTLHNVIVTDPIAGLSAISCSPATPATLAPNATIDCTATRTVTQADVDNGSVSNTATLSGLDPINVAITANGSKTVTANQVSSVALTKTASPNSNVNLGDTITYTFGVTNTGTVTLHNVGVTDPMTGLSAIGCTPAAPATLAPNATMSCTATYTVTQADVDNGSIANTATVSALNPANAPVTNTASAIVTTNQVQAMTATKTASPNAGVVAGDVVTYTVTGHNAGTVTLSNVTVTDPMTGLSPIGCIPAAPATLAPNADIVCTATYTVTQADVDAGSILNTATAHGTFGATTTDAPASTTVTADQSPELTVTKTASPNTGVRTGDTVTYTVAVQNTGTVTVDNTSVGDPMPGLWGFACTPVAPATLAPNATMTCTATYTVTQANVDAGSFQNTATASGTDPNGAPVTGSDSATVTADQQPGLSLTKSAVPNSGVVAGDVVTYHLTGTNSGNVTMHGVDVTDPMTGLSAITCTPAAPATLAPGDTVDCSATYTVTQADVDAGSIANTATISGLDPSNAPASNTGSTTVTADQSPALSLTKTATPNSGVVAGDTVTYTFHGQNTGTVTVSNVDVTDPMTGLSAIGCTPAAPATLAPNATIDCSATYTVTQADVDAGSIVNTATIAGLDPQNGPVSGTGGTTVSTDQAASLSLTKTATPNSGVVAGDTVTYTFHGQNTGTVSVSNVDVTDPMTGLSAIACTPTTPATLAPNATIDCSATYTVTQADVDAGSFSNTATIAGVDPSSNPVSTTGSATVTADQTPALSLTKTANPSTGVVAGDTVHYTMTASNDGSVTLHGVNVTDPMTGLSPITCTPAAPATLAPGATISCGADYTVTQADVDAGSFSNTASVTGLDPANAPTSATDGATVTADQTAGLSFTKTASPTSGVVAGDTITYSFHGQNTGTVTVSNVDVTDPMTGLSAIACTPTTPATLAPNATIDCSATYTVTQADVDAGSISNSATLAGDGPGGPVTRTDGTTVLTDQTASISLTKTASPTSGLALGDTVTYTMTATNTGAVSLHNVSVSDPMAGLSALSCTPAIPATLASGASVTCTATYTVTQADVNNGSITNTATVDALDPANAPVTDSASRTVLTGAAAGLSIVKTATPSSGVHVGDVVTYDLAVTNSGGLTVHGVDVTDPLAGLSAITCNPTAPATLAPSDTMDCSATYTVTQADVDAGTIVNTATVSGLDPADNPVTASDGTIVTTAAVGTPDAALSKKLQGVSGTTATWIVTVTNSGTAALPGPFTVEDTLPDGLTYESATGDGWDCTGTSVISCSHATDLAAGASAGITVATTITGTGTITNVASLDVLGESITSNASVTPPAPAGGFAFTGAEGRYGLMGLLLVVGGWLLLAATRRRRDDPLTER